MLSVQKSMRLHIALVGRVNAGKSSFLNLVTGQNVSITSSVAGTTTDVVEKPQELIPLGPVVWLDTAGLGDDGTLGKARVQRTYQAFDKADIVVLVCDGKQIGYEEEQILAEAAKRNLPVIRIYNKADLHHLNQNDNLKYLQLSYYENFRKTSSPRPLLSETS